MDKNYIKASVPILVKNGPTAQTATPGERFVRNQIKMVSPKYDGIAGSGRSVALSGDGYVDVPLNFDGTDTHGQVVYYDFDQKKHIAISNFTDYELLVNGDFSAFSPWKINFGDVYYEHDYPETVTLYNYYPSICQYITMYPGITYILSIDIIEVETNVDHFFVQAVNQEGSGAPDKDIILPAGSAIIGTNVATFNVSKERTILAIWNDTPYISSCVIDNVSVTAHITDTYRLENVTFNNLVRLWDREMNNNDLEILDNNPELLYEWSQGVDIGLSIGPIETNDLVWFCTEGA